MGASLRLQRFFFYEKGQSLYIWQLASLTSKIFAGIFLLGNSLLLANFQYLIIIFQMMEKNQLKIDCKTSFSEENRQILALRSA